MNKILYTICSAFILTSCVSVATYNEKVLQPHRVADLKKDVATTYKQLERNHPKLYQYISKESLEAKFDSLKQTITEPLTSRDFYEKLAPVVKSIGQGHISLVPPQVRLEKEKQKELKGAKNGFYTLDFINFGDELYVKDAIGADTVLIKSKVIAVDANAPIEVIEKYNTFISSDGYNKTLFENFVGARFAGFYKREKGFQDSIQVTFQNKDSIFNKTFAWFKNKKDTTIVKDSLKLPRKKLTKVEKKQAKKERKALSKYNSKRGYIASTKQYTRTLDFVDADSTVAYLKIRGFTTGNYEDFYAETFQLLDSLGTKNLVIDVRDNGGGRLSEIQDLYSYLAKETFQFITPSEVTNRIPVMKFALSNTNPAILKGLAIIASPVIITHNILKTKKVDGKLYYSYKYVKPMEPKETAFSGDVYVLINGNSFSASSILSNYIQATKRGTLVGTETGGAYNGTVAGFFRVHKLKESQVRIRLGLMQIETPYKQEPDGYGVKPDVEISTSKEQWLQDIDAEMQWILKDIESKTATKKGNVTN